MDSVIIFEQETLQTDIQQKIPKMITVFYVW